MRIVLTGGGSGGHLVPLIAVYKKIKERVANSDDLEFLFIGPKGKLEEDIIGKEGIAIKNILTGKFRRYFSWQNFVDCLKVPIGFFQSLWYLLIFMPDAVFSKGGHASIGVVLAAWIYRIPILIHESDAIPGLANDILGKFSTRVAVSYEEAEKDFPSAQVVLTGNPLREDINKGDAQKARERFKLTDAKKIIYITGGSQGARVINNKILEILPKLLKKYQIIHHTGAANFEDVSSRVGELGIKIGRDGYVAAPFFRDELKDIYAACDLVISRASANTISEIGANKKPSILIPLPSAANNHQRMNAYLLAKKGACVVLEENNLGENLLLSRIEEIMEDSELQNKLSENISLFYHPDAADKIADGILSMIKK